MTELSKLSRTKKDSLSTLIYIILLQTMATQLEEEV